MVDWGDWGWLAPAAPWLGAAVALMAALVATATVWARWKPEPGDEAGGLPLSLRWIPALTLGIAFAAVVWLLAPAGQRDLQMGLAAAAAFGVTVACAVWLGRTGERAVRAVQQESFWRLNAEAVAAHMRHLFLREEVMAYAAQTIMEELHASRLHVYLLKGYNFELAASLSAKAGQAEVFSKRGLAALAFCAPQRVPFVEYVNPRTDRPARWAHALLGASTHELRAEQKRLEAMGAEAGVAFWRNSQLAGFFLIGGRLKNEPFSDAQRGFTIELAAEVGRMLDVLDGAAERLAQLRASEEQAKTRNEMAVLVRRRMTPPDVAEVAGLEFGVSTDHAGSGRAAFCDTVVLPASGLGLAMAETDATGPQAAADMVRLQALLRSRFYVYGEDLREMLDSVERAITAGEPPEKPVRLLLGRYDARSRRFVYINAGYEPPVLMKNRSDGSETRRLSVTGRALAAGGPADWVVEEIELRRRDLLVLLSPGLISSRNPQDKWSEHLLLEKLLDLEIHSAPAMAQRLLLEAPAAADEASPAAERSVIVLRPAEAALRPLLMTARAGA
ncbi:MAG: PP2C family protein-serine/threonine phosphatase [Bryobacteraceae bacterium]